MPAPEESLTSPGQPGPAGPVKLAVVTPTCNRAGFLAQTYRYFKAQQAPGLQLHWFVLDDSPAPNPAAWTAQDPSVSYCWHPEKLPLGAKRNRLNDLAQAWGARTICSMDDDDWYGSTYAASMHALLQTSGHTFAGSALDYLLDSATGRILRLPEMKPGTSCNGVLCFDASVLNGRRYDETARLAEEPSFIRNSHVAQHPDVLSIHLALAHTDNTATKKNYLYWKELLTLLSLDDLPMSDEDRKFYTGLRKPGLKLPA